MNIRYKALVLILLLVLVIACAQTQEIQEPQPAPIKGSDEDYTPKPAESPQQVQSDPVLNIISPKDGELIKNSNVMIQLSAENFKIVLIGQPVKEGEGHFHVWLDSDRKVTTEKIFVFEDISSGRHSIVAELVKSDHSSLNPKITKALNINVESDYVPPQQAQEAGVSEFDVEADDHGFYPSTIKAKIGDKVKINFKFRDSSIYYAGLDIKGPFEDIKYKLKGEQPITREFTMKGETKITSYWPASGVKKATLIVEVEK